MQKKPFTKKKRDGKYINLKNEKIYYDEYGAGKTLFLFAREWREHHRFLSTNSSDGH